jgi:hypothetical protein
MGMKNVLERNEKGMKRCQKDMKRQENMMARKGMKISFS